jgi:pimeloyl-ACP methyl ester carboxylesterase
MKAGYLSVNGINMYYEIHGEGEPLVLIHGGGSTITTSFGRLLPLLANHHKIIAVELQAHGHTTDRDASESFEQDADDVAALVKGLAINKTSILGFSNGGNTAMQIAIRHPGLVNKLILASTFYKREAFFQGFFEGMKTATIDVMPKILRDAFLQVNDDETRLLNMFNKDKERMLNFTDWKDELVASIQAPTLIISGDRDVVSPSHAVAMSEVIHRARLMILPAEHGSYLGSAESAPPTKAMLELTVSIINDFLGNQASE